MKEQEKIIDDLISNLNLTEKERIKKREKIKQLIYSHKIDTSKPCEFTQEEIEILKRFVRYSNLKK